jgi:hypothetical protein
LNPVLSGVNYDYDDEEGMIGLIDEQFPPRVRVFIYGILSVQG